MKSSKGFTLIEIIVVMAVFLFVIGAAINIFYSIVGHQRRILSEQQLLNQISYAEEYMSKALRMAKSEFYENCLVDSQNPPQDHPGYIYLLTHYDSVAGIYQGIKFINPSDVTDSGNPTCQEFFLDNGVLKELKNSRNINDAVALTPASIHINSIRFAVNGADGSTSSCSNTTDCPTPYCCGASDFDSVQPRVTILLNVNIPGNSQNSSIACNQDSVCRNNDVCDLSTHKCTSTRIIETTVSQRNLNVK